MSDARSSFLGTLSSELDDTQQDMDEAFETLATLCGVARAAYLDSRLTPEHAAALFALLRLTASDGQEWTLGPTTGGWFSRPRGSSAWRKAPLPVGLSLAAGGPPAWLTDGIGGYLEAHMLTPVQESPVQERPAADPAAAVQAPALAVAPRPAVDANADTDWLLEEWGGFDRQLAQMRGQSALEPTLPADVPDEWDADKALVAALEPEGVVMPRVGSGPLDPAWEPAPREDDVLPESFFLPPTE
jgi:hypothetical protein